MSMYGGTASPRRAEVAEVPLSLRYLRFWSDAQKIKCQQAQGRVKQRK